LSITCIVVMNQLGWSTQRSNTGEVLLRRRPSHLEDCVEGHAGLHDARRT